MLFDTVSGVKSTHDVVVIGSGPNGLAAAIFMAQRGRSVLVLEAEENIGGGLRSSNLTLPGYIHDLCSAVHPMALASPFLRSLPLERYGLEWIHPQIPLAHPLVDGTAVVLDRSVAVTSERLGRDGESYRKLMLPITENWSSLEADILGPPRIPSHPIAMGRFALKGLQSASRLARGKFRTPEARLLFSGIAAHSIIPLEKIGSAAIGLVLAAVGHRYGWPIPKGGAQRVADALARYLRSLGGVIQTGVRVTSLDRLPQARIILCDLTPQGLLRIAGDSLPKQYRNALKAYRYGPGVFKIDWALNGPIPWSAKECCKAATVHLGSSLEEIELSERACWRGLIAEAPFVLLTQPSLFDSSRAPDGCHVAWAYCHVPNGSTFDMTERIEDQIERFAPGFRRTVKARCISPPAALQNRNANLEGGDISGGANLILQLLMRPNRWLYRTPLQGVYLCSSSTPPGGGVHGMCGYHAARTANEEL